MVVALTLTTNVGPFQRAFRRWSDRSNEVLIDALRQSAVEILAEAKEQIRSKGIGYTGELAASGQIRIDEERLRAEVVFVSEHARFVEGGRSPGGYPPIPTIRAWARQKLGITDPAVVWAIARRIAQRGTDPQPFLEPAIARIRGIRLNAILRRHVEGWVDDWNRLAV